ncbi:MAG: pyridoxamine 5'-phosphate oxidase family protein [Bacteroidota bacterium]|nr:pyridoxamine 5'-phosphate oxidase family protein [Bacteroidota bacterium]
MQDSRLDEKDHIQNYTGVEAVKKLKEMAEDARMCFFTTFSDTRPLPSRPMALQGVDEDGTLNFFSAKSSNKNYELHENPAVQLYFANGGSSEYLSVYGKATISQDMAKINELWTAWAKAWFQGGPEDPELTLIQVKPEVSEYWDTKVNKVVSLIKIAASIVTGKVNDDGVEGKLNI